MSNTAPIVFFNGSICGLSVLREASKSFPNEDYICFGDSKNTPIALSRKETI